MTRTEPSLMARVARAVDGTTDIADLVPAVAQSLRSRVAFDHLCLGEVDPATHLVTSKFDFGDRGADPRRILENEYTEPDFAKFAALARSPRLVALLNDETDGAPVLSGRFRQILAPLGFSDEARVALGTGGALWGFLEILRDEGRPAFSPDEAGLLRAVAPVITRGICRHWAARPAAPSTEDDALPGVLVLDAAGRLLSASEEGRLLLHELSPGPRLPPVVEMVFVAARASFEERPATARVRCASGRWLTVSARSLAPRESEPSPSVPGVGEDHYVIVLQDAKPSELTSMLFLANGLSQREKEVALAVWRQLSTGEIARQLYISAYTVQDHLKSIFQKLGVRSRRELVALILNEDLGTPRDARSSVASSRQ